MAKLVPCKGCGASISNSAAACPSCGHPARKRSSVFSVVVVGVGLFVFAGYVLRTVDRANEVPAPKGRLSAVAKAPPTPDGRAEAAASAPALRTWEYNTAVDEMRHATRKTALTTSDEELSFAFPYNRHPNHAYLIFQTSPAHEPSALIHVDQGQFHCGLNCIVSLRFDDGPIQRVTAYPSASGRSDAIFLPYGSTLAGVRKARVLTAEVPFWQEGNEQLHFVVAGLDWK